MIFRRWILPTAFTLFVPSFRAHAEDRPRILIVDATGNPAHARTAAEIVRRGLSEQPEPARSKGTEPETYIVAEPAAMDAARGVAEALDIEPSRITSQRRVKQARVVVVLGVDWLPPPAVDEPPRPKRKRRAEWHMGLQIGFIPIGRLEEDNLGTVSAFEEKQDFGSDLYVERRIFRWFNMGVSLGGLWGIHLENKDDPNDIPKSSIGIAAFLEPYARLFFPITRMELIQVRLGVGAAAFRSNVEDDPDALGYTGDLSFGFHRQFTRRWHAGIDVGLQALRIHPNFLNTWLFLQPQLLLRTGFRF